MQFIELTSASFHKNFFPDFSFEMFLKNYFRKKMYYSRSSIESHYRSIFAPCDFAELLGNNMLHRPSVRMIGEGRVLPMEEIYIDIPYGKFSFDNVVNMDSVKYWYDKGYTINVRGAHQYHEGLRKTSFILSELFSCNVKANLYLTPDNESGLIPHYDAHDVLVIQVFGSKKWRFYENNFNFPTEQLRFKENIFDVGDVKKEITLVTGDILYIPRGVSHSATAIDKSLHLTIGIEEPTILDVLKSLVNVVENRDNLRLNINCAEVISDPNCKLRLINNLKKEMTEAIIGNDLDQAIKATLDKNLQRTPKRDISFLTGV